MVSAGRTAARSTGRQILIAVYAVFAVAAGARSAVQIATRYDEAEVAYLKKLRALVERDGL